MILLIPQYFRVKKTLVWTKDFFLHAATVFFFLLH